MTDPAPRPPSAAAPPRGPNGDSSGDVAAVPDDGHARRALALILPFAQLVPPILPALGIGHGVGTMSAAAPTPAIPAGYAFPVMWTLLFALSLAFGIWQALPAGRREPLLRRVGWPLIGVFAANTLWQLVAIFSARNSFTLFAIIVVGLCCALAAHLLSREGEAEGEGGDGAAAGGRARRWLLRPLCGLMAGWLSAAAFANLSGAATAAGMVAAAGFAATLSACLIILAAGGFAGFVLRLSRPRVWYAAGAGWALLAVAAANLGLDRFDLPAAATAAAMMALVTASARPRRPHPDSATRDGAA